MLVCACRAKMMGFNAARLEWNVAGLAASPKSVSTSDCDIATAADIESSLLPPTTTDTPQPTGNPTLPQTAPSITGDTCSADLPTTSTTDRFVYMANYLCGQVYFPAQLACRLTGTAFVQSMENCIPLLDSAQLCLPDACSSCCTRQYLHARSVQLYNECCHPNYSVPQCTSHTSECYLLNPCVFVAGVLRGLGVPQREHNIRWRHIHSKGS